MMCVHDLMIKIICCVEIFLYDEPIKSKASITKRVVDGLKKKKRNEEFSIKKKCIQNLKLCGMKF